MAISLGFHMIFAAAGIAMPVLMLMAEGLWLRTGKPHYQELAQKWAKATGLLFAIGAVSGTALSFELGLLWPKFMEFSGSMIGPAFALEGFAFFIEAIFLGLYLYGWKKLSPWAHWWTGVPVAVSGLLSGAIVVAVNSWMQYPVGFELNEAGQLINIDPWGPFRSPFWLSMAVHSSLSCYIAVSFAVAGVYALGLLRGRRDEYHRSALALAMCLATLMTVLQPISGDINSRIVAKYHPIKLAAIEGLFETRAAAPLLIGGIPDEATRTVSYGLEIPGALSFALTGDSQAVIPGLDQAAPDEWPNVLWTHLAFQVMVACGMILLGLVAAYWLIRWTTHRFDQRWLLLAILGCSPLGFIALEAGWIVTEVGRQPWTVHKLLRTADAVTPVADVPSSLLIFTALYAGLGVALVTLLLRLAGKRAESPEQSVESKE